MRHFEKVRLTPSRPIKRADKISKIVTTSKVSVELTSRINL